VCVTVSRWEAELAGALGKPVKVVYGRSRSAPIQVRPVTAREVRARPRLRGGLVVRVHALFGAAPAEVRDALARWIRSGLRARRACRELDGWMHAALAALPPRPAPRERLRPAGARHDLSLLGRGLLAAELAGEFGPGRSVPGITWGRRGRSLTRGGLRLGSYVPGSHVVRLHPVLDQAAVPGWFVRYVLFHELLHAALPRERAEGRAVHHGRAFQRRERAYPDYRRAVRWEREHIDALVRAARSGRPMPRRRARREAAHRLQGLLFSDLGPF